MDNNLNSEHNITISAAAAAQFLDIMKANNIPEDYSLRIDVIGSKHEGFSYQLGFDNNIKDDDTVIESEGLKFLISSESIPSLKDTSIDFKEDSCCGGFIFNNPNAANSCDCHNHN